MLNLSGGEIYLKAYFFPIGPDFDILRSNSIDILAKLFSLNRGKGLLLLYVQSALLQLST